MESMRKVTVVALAIACLGIVIAALSIPLMQRTYQYEITADSGTYYCNHVAFDSTTMYLADCQEGDVELVNPTGEIAIRKQHD